MDIGYARVSTGHQDLERQIGALTSAGVVPERIYQDKKTGANTRRDGLREALDFARPGDTIVVHTLDRLARNMRDTLNLIHELTERGIGLRTLADPMPIDTSNDNAMGRLAVLLLALFAEMERTWNRERVAHARTVAGKAPGRPRAMTADQVELARRMRASGETVNTISQTLGVSRATLYRALEAVTTP